MEIKEALRSLLQEMILPEFENMKAGQAKTEERLNSLDKRLGDVNMHLMDQSRRIDEINKRLSTVSTKLLSAGTNKASLKAG